MEHKGRNRKLGWLAIALGAVALFMTLGGRGHHGRDEQYSNYRQTPPSYGERGGWGGRGGWEQQYGPQQQYGSQAGPQQYGTQAGPQQYGPQQNWNAPYGARGYDRFEGSPMFGRGHRHPPFFMLPFLIIGGIIKFVLFAFLVALFLRFLGKRGPWGRGGPGGPSGWGRGPWGHKHEQAGEQHDKPTPPSQTTSERPYTGETQSL